MKISKYFTALFLMLCVTGFCMSNVSAGKIGDIWIIYYETVKVGDTIVAIGPDSTVELIGDAASYVDVKYFIGGKFLYMVKAIKPTPVGKTADFKVHKKIVGPFEPDEVYHVKVEL